MKQPDEAAGQNRTGKEGTMSRLVEDTRTVIWKEWKELLTLRGSTRSGIMGLVVSVGVFGILLPIQLGQELVLVPSVLLFWAWVPLLLVVAVIADAFAGERERHTLETLLASRLSDRAILLGKIGAAVLYGWGLTLLSLALGLITVNVANVAQGWVEGPVLFPPMTLLGVIGASFLTAWMAAGAGVLVSLRAGTVRQAQQTLSIGVMILLFGTVYGLRALPQAAQLRLLELLSALGTGGLVLAIGTILLIIDVALFWAASARFQRDRLILD